MDGLWRKWTRALPVVMAVFTLFSAPAKAATVSFDYGISFGAVAPDGPTPYATAVFDDGGSAGSVTLTLSLSAFIGQADAKGFYFNLDPLLDPTDLSFSRTGGDGPVAKDIEVNTGIDAFQADGDGIYDIWFDLPPPPGNQAKRFNAGEFLEFEITGIASLTVDDFDYLATPGGGATPPFLSVVRFVSTGTSGEGSDWVGAEGVQGPSEVPVPAAFWLFASGLLGLLGIARKKVA